LDLWDDLQAYSEAASREVDTRIARAKLQPELAAGPGGGLAARPIGRRQRLGLHSPPPAAPMQQAPQVAARAPVTVAAVGAAAQLVRLPAKSTEGRAVPKGSSLATPAAGRMAERKRGRSPVPTAEESSQATEVPDRLSDDALIQ
jgi:hypothetical protein